MILKKKDSNSKSLEIETHIGVGVWLEGEMKSGESIRLDGFFKGNVTVSETLVIGETGKLLGHVKAKNLMCAGKIQGNVDVDEITEFISGGALVGDIETGELIMPKNVYFKGNCNMKNSIEEIADDNDTEQQTQTNDIIVSEMVAVTE